MYCDPGYNYEGSNPPRYTNGVFSISDNIEITAMLPTDSEVKLRARHNNIPHAAYGKLSLTFIGHILVARELPNID